jgi:putative endonuclease
MNKSSQKPYQRHTRGQLAESMAQKVLLKNGLRLITQNYRCKIGEIDLIFWDGEEIVFVEVRARANSDFAFPTETIDYFKQLKIIRTAEFFLLRHAQWAKNPCRFDVVGVNFSTSPPNIEWIKDAFTGDLSC